MGAGFKVEFVEEEGAVLYLPKGASREKLLNIGALKSMVESQASRWKTFAQKHGRDPSASIVVVTMCDKTSMFATLTFSGASRSAGISAMVSASGLVDGKVSWNFSSTNYQSLDSHIGPMPPSLMRNQCVFLRFLVLPDPGKSLLKWFEKQNPFPRLGSPFKGSTSHGSAPSPSPNRGDTQVATSNSNSPDVNSGVQVNAEHVIYEVIR